MKRPRNSTTLECLSNRTKESGSIFTTWPRSPFNRRISRLGAIGAALALLVAFSGLPLTQLKGAAFDESINTFASSNCSTSQNVWNLGETACAVATDTSGDRRIAWVAPNGAIARLSDTFSGTLSDSYTIPTGSDPFAQVGTWTVETIDGNGVGFSSAEFVVKDPAHANVDLSVGKFGPFQVSAGGNVSYRVEFANRGPDDAQNVTLVDSIPANTTFVSETQDSGSLFNCTTPTPGSGSGTITCTIATLPANDSATFTLTFNVNSGTPTGTLISNSATLTSNTNELHSQDNSAIATSTVVGATSGCTVSCPSVSPVSTDQCSTVVTYAAPSTAGDCGTPPEGSSGVVCAPPSGSSFPVGTTTVICTAQTGDTCNFAVTVNYTGSLGALTITCPSDQVVNAEDVSAGTATVTYPGPTTNGSCVTVACSPPSGSTFSVGITTVTCTAIDAAQESASCSFNVTVNNASAGGCSITCSDDVIANATSSCSAVVSYPAPATSGTCGAATCNPPSGSTFPVGTTAVSCGTPEGASCSFTVTVLAPAPPAITTCATNKTLSAVANCAAPTPNLLGEVVATGCSVVLSQSPAAGTPLDVGIHTVTITAENSAGEATCTVTVTVVDNFTGFFPPVDNLPTLNLVNAGRAIPVKFSLGGDLGLDIFAEGYPASVVIECNSGDPAAEVEETVAAGGSSLSYDAGSNEYRYVWKTESSWAGTCRQLVIRLKNGCEYRANFKLR